MLLLQIESTDFAGGRINLVENTINNTLSQDIQYHHTDHLGSVRAITNQSGEIVEQNAYYPFGERHTFGNTYAQTTNRFKYNGKEEQTAGNLGLLDYGARMYDANIGRWFVQDPLSEKYYAHSPYNYCVNNPVMFVDPDGKKIKIGNLLGRLGAYLGINTYEKQVMDHIAQLKEISPELNRVINNIEESEFTIRIEHTDKKSTNSHHNDNGNAFSGNRSNVGTHKAVPSGGTLFYDPNNDKTNSGEVRNPIIGLAHELGHAENQIKGEYVVYKSKRKEKLEILKDETRSLELENIIRRLLNTQQRKSYFKE